MTIDLEFVVWYIQINQIKYEIFDIPKDYILTQKNLLEFYLFYIMNKMNKKSLIVKKLPLMQNECSKFI